MAVRFDAAADRLTHNGAYPQTSAGWTYTAWVRIDVDRNDYSTWLRTSASASTVATMGTNSNGTQGANYFTASGSATTNTDLTVGVWVPVAGTRSASSGDLFTYYQPTPGTTISGTVDLATSDVTATPDQICIGGRGSADANEWLNGSVAYVRVWSAELTQSEIEAEWASAAPVRTTDLHSNWTLDDLSHLTDTVGSKVLSPQSGGVLESVNGPLFGTENLCPNPAADVDLTGWSGDLGIATATNNQTAAVVRETGLTGFPKSTGFRYNPGAGNSGFARSAPAPASPGVEYTVSFWGQHGVLANGDYLGTWYIVWYNSSGGDISYDNQGGFGASANDTPMRRFGTATAPAGTVGVGIIVDGKQDCIVSCVQVEEGNVLHDYADGDTDGWQWDGTAGLSSSQALVASDADLKWIPSGTDGTDISAANAGFDEFYLGSGNTATYSNTQAYIGASVSGKFETVSGTPQAALVWTDQWGTQTEAYISMYAYFTAYSAGRVGNFVMTGGNSTLVAGLDMQVDGKLIIKSDGAGFTGTTSANAVPLNQWVRIELDVTCSTTVGAITVRVYNASDSRTADDTFGVTAQNVGADCDAIRTPVDVDGFGPMYIAGYAVSSTSQPGVFLPISIDGTASAASLSTGALNRSRPLAGNATAASGIDDTPFSITRSIGGSTSGAALATGALSRTASLAGSSSAASGTAQTVLTVLRTLSGKATAASLARGALTNLSLSWGGYLGNLLDRGMEPVTVYLEEVTTDADGNTWTRAATEGIDTMATIQVAAASGTSSRRAEQDNEGFETEENWRIRFPRQFPYVLGAQSKVEWRGLTYSVVGDARRYNGSRRTAHIEYIIRRS